MGLNLVSILALLAIGFISCTPEMDCDKYPSDYIPENLNEALNYLDCNWQEQEKKKFSEKSEDEAISESHLGIGLGIRNSWGLWKEGEKKLVQYFDSLGIFHPDDISSIILTSYHRKLNNKEIDLEGQIQYYVDYWAPIQEHEKLETERAISSYKKYNIGDTIKFYIEVQNFDNDEIGVVGIGPDLDWSFNPDKDLKIEGVILEKNLIQDSNNVEFRVWVFKMNREEKIRTAFGVVDVGDTSNIELKYLRYE